MITRKSNRWACERMTTFVVASVWWFAGDSLGAGPVAAPPPSPSQQKLESRDLGGTWQVRPEPLACIGQSGLTQVLQAKDDWIPARVPGEIHLDLIRAGQMPEPTVGANMPKCRWPETKSWWYRTTFNVSKDFLAYERQQLLFDGLDLYAQVFLNGKLLGEAADAFVPAAFDVKRFLREGKNELVVRLTAGSELSRDDSPPGQGLPPHKPKFGEIPNPIREGDFYGHRNWYGRRWLRKPQAEYGWDWQDALPNIGIWRGVRLEGRSYAVLDDLRLDTLLHDGRASLEMEAVVENLHPWSERACVLALSIRPPDGGPTIERRYPIDAVPGRIPVRDAIEIPQAKLWWPNGMGGSRSIRSPRPSPTPREQSTIRSDSTSDCGRSTSIERD